jgi:hypothetical protein
MPLIGIIASSRREIPALAGFVGLDSFTAPNSSSNTITFNSIPQNYKHLMLVYQAQGTVNDGTRIRFNGDSGASNYLGGDGINSSGAGLVTTAISGAQSGLLDLISLRWNNVGTTSSAAVVYINDYSKNGKLKTAMSLDSNIAIDGTGSMRHFAGTRTSSTEPITSISIVARTGNFNTGSKVALFGIN